MQDAVSTAQRYDVALGNAGWGVFDNKSGEWIIDARPSEDDATLALIGLLDDHGKSLLGIVLAVGHDERTLGMISRHLGCAMSTLHRTRDEIIEARTRPTVREYVVENAHKADMAMANALQRGHNQDGAYWRGYRVALEALLVAMDENRVQA